MKDVFKGTIIPGPEPGQYRTLEKVAYIFVCPDCSYRWTAQDEHLILTVRDTHNRTVHPDKVVGVLWADSPLSVLT